MVRTLARYRAPAGIRFVTAVCLLAGLAAPPLGRAKDGPSAGASLRVADEVAPPGGLALIRVELTEPKPISGGRIRLLLSDFAAPSNSRAALSNPLGAVVAVGALSRSGDVQGTSSVSGSQVQANFSSPRSTFGTDLDLPILVVAVAVSADAAPGQQAAIALDPAGTQLIGPSGQPYPVEIKPGTLTVGGVSVTRIVSPSDDPPAGSVLTLKGVGFMQGARINIEGADLSSRVVDSGTIEVTTGAPLHLPDLGVRLRNPDGSEDMFYALSELREVTTSSRTPTLRFAAASATLVAGTSEELVLGFSPAVEGAGTLVLSNSNAAVLRSDLSAEVPAGASAIRLRVFAAAAGDAVLTATFAGTSASLPVRVVSGTVLLVPVLRVDALQTLGLALTNSGDVSAEVRLRGYRHDPSRPEEPARPAVEKFVQLAPREQTSRFLPQYDSAWSSFRGWVEVSSTSASVHAMFLNAPAAGLAFAGGSDPGAALEHYFPQSAVDPGGNFEFALVNNNATPAVATLEWRTPAGVETKTHSIAPQGVHISSPSEEFGFRGPLADGWLRVRSTLPLGAYQQQSGPFPLFGQMPPVSGSASNHLVLPQFVSGEGWFTEISIVNPGGSAAQVTVTLVGDAGTPAAGPRTNPARLSLPPWGQLIVRGAELLGLDGSSFVVGSLLLESDRPLVGSAVIGESASRRFVTRVPFSGVGATEFVFAQVANGDLGGIGYFTGLAFQNPNAQTVGVRIEVFSAQGQLTGQAALTLGAGARFSKLLAELVPGLGPQIGGHLHVTASMPVSALEIFGDDRLSFLTTVPPSVVR